MITVERRNDNESSRSVIQRFSRRVRSSGILREARSQRFYTRPMNRRQRREAAITRARRRKRRTWMKKRGLLD